MITKTRKNFVEIICGNCKYLVKQKNKCKFTGYCSRRNSLTYAISDD